MSQAACLALALGLALMAGTADAAIIGTYVDAEPQTGLLNTTPTGAFSPSYSGSFTDNLWDDRREGESGAGTWGLNSSVHWRQLKTSWKLDPLLREAHLWIKRLFRRLPRP